MTAPTNLARAIEAWRALTDDERNEVIGDISAEGMSSHGDAAFAHYAAMDVLRAAAEPEAIAHVTLAVTRSRPNGDKLASCGEPNPSRLVVAVKDSNCLACWKHYHGDADGERHFRKYHPEMP